jgi:hypothetical protein
MRWSSGDEVVPTHRQIVRQNVNSTYVYEQQHVVQPYSKEIAKISNNRITYIVATDTVL